MEIIWSNVANYQDVLESSFVEYLVSQNLAVKTQKNYKSDIRHFFSWITLTIQSQNLDIPQSHHEFLNLVSPQLLGQYKHFLLVNRIPAATINRRLSAIRAFGTFCQSKGWFAENPTTILTNVAIESTPKDVITEMLNAFRSDLAREGASKVTIKNYTSDVNQFLKWMEQQGDRRAAPAGGVSR